MRRWQWLAMLAAGLLSCRPVSDPQIRVEDAWVRPDPQMENAAGYFIAHNRGDEPDALIGLEVGFADSAEMHETIVDSGVHRMQAISRLEIPAGGVLEFLPLGKHVMMTGIREPLVTGERITYVLKFEIAGNIEVHAEVR